MKKILLGIFASLTFAGLQAQVINQGQLVIVGNYVVIRNLDFQNQSGATLDHKDGTVYFYGTNWTNNGTMVQQAAASTAATYFRGSSDQTIGGSNENFFNRLYIDHDAAATSSVNQNTNLTTNDLTVNDNSGNFEFKVKDPSASGLRLTVENNMTLNGNVRLYDDSQLLQTATTAPSGSGKLFRDQMGTGNKYWYNYWCAPVNNGGTWTLSSLMDGRDPDNPQAIVFENAYTTSGSPNVNSSQNPAHLNEAFIFKFENSDIGDYTSWVQIGSTNAINPGTGYTMKGPDIFNGTRPGGSGTTEFKAYTFAGTPNNGTYTFSIDGGKDYLVGNPYPSALDADAFINDNPGLNGTLYFWEHVNGSDHSLQGYVGGYATYTLAGGVPAKDWQTGSTTVGTKTPGRYIPVGQGFFVQRDDAGSATITFQNSQRAYFKEDNSNSVFMRSAYTDIRLGFTDPAGGTREILLAVRPGKSLGYDWGYDGRRFDLVHYGDMFFAIDTVDYVIQATDHIGGNVLIPLHVILNMDGQVTFGLNSATNVPSAMHFYIYDAPNNVTYEITQGPQSMTLSAGDYRDRFYLAFRPADQLNTKETGLQDLTATYAKGIIRIANPQGYMLNDIHVYAINGKEVYSRDLQTKQRELKLPVNLTTGVYIYRINANDATQTGKFLVE